MERGLGELQEKEAALGTLLGEVQESLPAEGRACFWTSSSLFAFFSPVYLAVVWFPSFSSLSELRWGPRGG